MLARLTTIRYRMRHLVRLIARVNHTRIPFTHTVQFSITSILISPSTVAILTVFTLGFRQVNAYITGDLGITRHGLGVDDGRNGRDANLCSVQETSLRPRLGSVGTAGMSARRERTPIAVHRITRPRRVVVDLPLRAVFLLLPLKLYNPPQNNPVKI